ncbi:S8 family serine peptidase [Sulfurisphaera javensis]|uniref:S8 family serine peptidase n=1 Tax=Sulfurisphaera javensis TaxID=2049879 RepID=A0AAT9GNV1_9CREN
MWSLLFLILIASSVVLPLYLQPNVSEISSNQIVNVSIVIPPKNLELLQLYVEEHHIVNSSELETLFIPNSTINKIVNMLVNNGIQPEVTLNVISFQAKAGIVEKLFHGQFITTEILGKKIYYFISSSTSFPGIILATNLTYLFLSKPNNLVNITQAIAYNMITPSELQSAYNITFLIKHGINGSGVNIGILDFEGDPYIYQQLQDFDSQYNLPNPPIFKVVPIGPYNPNDGIPSGWALEISLDVEYAHAAAPGAGIILYVANPSISIPQAIAYIDQQDQVSVVSQSWGIPEIYFLLGLLPISYLQSMIYEYWLGEAEGITFIAASGDAGGNGYNFFLSPLGSTIVPASIPYVLAVGGTTLYVSENSTYQTAWSGESIIGSTTGGYSAIFPSPPYQGLEGFRITPDVVADANPYTGVPVVYYYNTTYLVGGTSLATPIVAGIIALADQVHGKLGFINPLIYSLNGTKAIVPVSLGYNTPYIANNSLNPVTGLGYINAGYFVSLLRIPTASLSLAVQNTTYLPGQAIKVIGYLNGVSSPPVTLTAYVYNGSAIVSTFTLSYNGSAYIGDITLSKSGIYEIYSKFNNIYGFTYVTVGYQAVFVFPIVAIYPIPSNIPVIVMITYPNGTLVSSFNTTNLTVYKENQLNGKIQEVTQVKLNNLPIINISQLGIYIKFKSGILEGYINLTSKEFGGVYVLSVNNTIGLDEIVLGMYVVPAVIPNSFSEPTSLYSGENVTLEVLVESLGMPNVTVSFIKDGKIYYSTPVNSITVGSSSYYIAQVNIPRLPSGYYTIEAYADYSNGTYIAYGVGYTQIYISNESLVLHAKVNSVTFENDTITISANIYYPNGTPVKYGVFSAIFVPSYLLSDIDSLQISYSVPLTYKNGIWIGNFTVPAGSYSNSGVTVGEIAGTWNVYIVGLSANGIPLPFDSTINYNTLNIEPTSTELSFLVLPFNYIPTFTGSYAYHIYTPNAIISNKTVVLVNSIIDNLTAINSVIYSYNSEIYHVTLINSKIVNISNISNISNNIKVINDTIISTSTSISTSNNITASQLLGFGDLFMIELVIALIINSIVVMIFVIGDKNKR